MGEIVDTIVDFAKDNVLLAVAGCLLIIFILIALLFVLVRPRKRKEAKDKAQFEKGIERFDQRYMKKCKHCGASVPIDDNICMSCGEIPN